MKNINKNRIKKFAVIIVVAVITVFLANALLEEKVIKSLYILFFLLFLVMISIKGLKISGLAEIITIAELPVMPFLTKLLAASPFADFMAGIYNDFIAKFFYYMGIKTDYKMGGETSVALTFWLLFMVVFLCNNKDHTAMKIKEGNDDQEFKQKNYAQKSEMFCKTLRQRLESINRETDWNENLFTPIEAEVEVNIKGKHKKKFEDLLKCLKSIKHKGAIFLVLGEPGAGKSVSLRKLCLELLDESKKTKKIPVYINLKKWNRDWNLTCLPTKKDLIDFIKESLYENGDIFTEDFLNNYFDKMLEDGRWYFVFDSFDEMPCLMGKQNCQELIDKISELLCQFMTGANQSGGIIASRMYKSPSEAIGATVVLKIQEFNDIKIKTMLQKYLNNADRVISELFGKRESLVVLSRNPFYLTLLINYIRDKGLNFPRNQMELYQNFVEGRLKRCSGKLESEHIDRMEVHNAAKKLAVFMQQSSTYGLECPIAALIQGEDENYWRKALRLLEYAKICRLGGGSETVSFVHRRFQEFFLVESLIERGEDIAYKEYNDIVKNASMRDALVLYCEVIEEAKAKEIAKFCWKVIQKNMKHTKNILEEGSMELVNVLYFMAEAFRNRKSAIEEFKKEFEELIDNILNNDTDFVILLACTNSMVLFEQEYLQKMVLKVFQLKNRWLNDVVIQNCRVINRLDSQIETQFTIYFLEMNLRMFLERFRNVQFSLSLSKNFRYIKIVHFIIFSLYMSCIVMILVFGLFAIGHFSQYIILIRQMMGKVNLENLIMTNFWGINTGIGKVSIYLTTAISMSILLVFDYLADKIIKYPKFCLILVLALLLALLCFPMNKVFGTIIISIIYIIFYSFICVISFHELHYIWKQKSLKKVWSMKKIQRFLVSLLLIWVLTFVTVQFIELMGIVILGFVSFTIILLAVFAITYGLCFLHDWNWTRNCIELKSMDRKSVLRSMRMLRLRRFRRAYIDDLLQRKVQLTGEWPNDARPKLGDDKLDVLLAKLDCLTLESYNYLF